MERINDMKQEPEKNKVLFIGIAFILLGAIVFTKHMNWLPDDLHQKIFSWKSILIIAGTLGLFFAKNKGFSAIILLVGSFFLAGDFYNLSFDFKKLVLPFIFIFIGIMLIFHRRKGPQIKCRENDSDSSEYIDNASIFGGGKVNILSDNFKGGKILSIFGGSEINLNNCQLATGKQIIDIFMVFGGTVIIVPPDWSIKIEIISIFGGFSDKRINYTNESKKEDKELHIRGMAIFGGGEIKNY